jgi:hypothetical protein
VNIIEQECRFVTTDTDTGILCHKLVSVHFEKCFNKSGIIFRHGLYY